MTAHMVAQPHIPMLVLVLFFAVVGACTSLPGLDGGVAAKDSGPAPVDPTFAVIQRRILTPSCGLMSCHGSAVAPAGHLLIRDGESYAQLVGVRAYTRFECMDGGIPDGCDPDAGPHLIRVVPGSPDDSFMMQKLEMDDMHLGVMCRGREMPRTGQRLGQIYRDAIREWIAQGAQNN